MKELIERLRNYEDGKATRLQAADTIEAQQRTIAALNSLIGGETTLDSITVVERLTAVVEHLNAENKLLHERHSFALRIFKEQQSALEAARAELALAKEVMAHDRKYIDELLGKLK